MAFLQKMCVKKCKKCVQKVVFWCTGQKYSEILNEDMKYVNNKGHGRGRIELGREGCAPPPTPLSLNS